MTQIGGVWYMETIAKRLSPLRRPKLGKNQMRSRITLKKYMKLIGIVMIGNPKYIGTSLNGFHQKVKSKVSNPIQFLQENTHKYK